MQLGLCHRNKAKSLLELTCRERDTQGKAINSGEML